MLKAFDVIFRPDQWPEIPLPENQTDPKKKESARVLYRLAVEGRIAAITTVAGSYVWAKAVRDGKLAIVCLGESEREDALATITRDHGTEVSIVEGKRSDAKRLMKSRGIR